MVFHAHIAVALCLLAIVAGSFLICKSHGDSCPDCCKKWNKVVGWIVIAVAALSLVCTFYHSCKVCRGGYTPPCPWTKAAPAIPPAE